MALKPNREPGESEFSHGRGLQPPAREGALRLANTGVEEWTPTVYEEGKAIQRTDSADPEATADYTAAPNTPANQTEHQWVREQ